MSKHQGDHPSDRYRKGSGPISAELKEVLVRMQTQKAEASAHRLFEMGSQELGQAAIQGAEEGGE